MGIEFHPEIRVLEEVVDVDPRIANKIRYHDVAKGSAIVHEDGFVGE